MKILHGAARPTLVSVGQESDQKRLFLPFSLSLQDDDRSTQMEKSKDKGKCIRDEHDMKRPEERRKPIILSLWHNRACWGAFSKSPPQHANAE